MKLGFENNHRLCILMLAEYYKKKECFVEMIKCYMKFALLKKKEITYLGREEIPYESFKELFKNPPNGEEDKIRYFILDALAVIIHSCKDEEYVKMARDTLEDIMLEMDVNSDLWSKASKIYEETEQKKKNFKF